MPRRIISLLLLVATASVASAAPLDAEPTTEYRWHVVVRFEPHPLLSARFREQITQAVRGSLQPAIEAVGRVDVTDLASIPDAQRDPLCKAFAEKGWPALDAPAFRQLTGVKTHFLRVAVANGEFRLEARQHDGSTGLASPLVRTRATRDPQKVGRLAGLLVGRDFGPIGTIEPLEKEPDAVKVHFRGGQLPGFERFVHAGDVFAISVIHEMKPRAVRPKPGEKPAPDPAPVRVGQPQQYTLLRAEGPAEEGVCKCRVLTNLREPFRRSRGVIGFRCMKLATVEGPFELRVADLSGRPQPAGQLLQVRATDGDFGVRMDARDALELRDGVFHSTRPLRNVACVVVSLSSDRAARFPVPVLGEGPLTVRFEINPEAVAKAAFERACLDLRGRVAEARTAQFELVSALSRLILTGKNADALQRATDGLRNQDAADKELTAELDRLKKQPGAKEEYPAELLDAAARQLQAMRQDRVKIETRANELKIAAVKANDPVRFEKEFRAKELATRISQLVGQGEIPEALNLYDQLAELTKQADVLEKKKKLAAEWEPKNAEHKQARDYVTNEWRKVADAAGFRAAAEPLKEAVEVLIKYDDRLGLRNVLSSFEPAYARLQGVVDSLDPNSAADAIVLKELQTAVQSLRTTEGDARAAVKRLEGAKGAGP